MLRAVRADRDCAETRANRGEPAEAVREACADERPFRHTLPSLPPCGARQPTKLDREPPSANPATAARKNRALRAVLRSAARRAHRAPVGGPHAEAGAALGEAGAGGVERHEAHVVQARTGADAQAVGDSWDAIGHGVAVDDEAD